ncbi:MAG TPA: c-type cytochrome [Candidatus Acidoferrales bacterium]|nr:c-type cytochrome [Candidatus Acidoferrales bacterium]
MRREVLLIILIAILSFGLAAQTITKAPAQYTPPDSGKQMFTAYCASCHGADAKGNGPAADAMKTATPDLTRISAHNKGKFPLFHVETQIEGKAIAAHGALEMPVWATIFRHMSPGAPEIVQQRVHNLTKYIESLQAM